MNVVLRLLGLTGVLYTRQPSSVFAVSRLVLPTSSASANGSNDLRFSMLVIKGVVCFLWTVFDFGCGDCGCSDVKVEVVGRV